MSDGLTTSNYRDVQRGVRTTITSHRGGRGEGTSIIFVLLVRGRAIKLVRIARNYKRAEHSRAGLLKVRKRVFALSFFLFFFSSLDFSFFICFVYRS